MKLKEKEMKRLMGLVAALALLAGGSVANAADNAWFSLESTTCAGVIVNAQGPGQDLAITKNNGPTCNLTIGYNATAGDPRQMTSYAFKLFNTPDVSLVGAVDNSPAAALGMGTTFNFATAGAFVDFGAANQAGVGNNGGLLARFTIQVNKPNAGPHLIGGDFGTSAQAYANGELWFGSVGAGSGPQYGQAGYTGAGDNGNWGTVISITNVPEPATLALLGFGVVALIRRRK